MTRNELFLAHCCGEMDADTWERLDDEYSKRESEMVQAGGSVLEAEPDHLLRGQTSGLYQPLPFSGTQQEAGTN